MRISNILFFLLCFSAAVAGCSQPLRTLMAVDAEQKGQQVFVRREEARFKALQEDAGRGAIKTGVPREEIVRRYGEPVLKTETSFLYRGPVAFFNAEKIYMDFDDAGLLKAVRIEETVPDAEPKDE